MNILPVRLPFSHLNSLKEAVDLIAEQEANKEGEESQSEWPAIQRHGQILW